MKCRIITGDCRLGLRRLADASVHAAVTSPPYYCLRDYQTFPVVFDGEEGCEHSWGEEIEGPSQRWGDPESLSTRQKTNRGSKIRSEVGPARSGAFCVKCQAWRGELGQEPSPNLYVQHLVEVFREVKRVLRPDGVLWVVIGDCYSGSGKGRNKDGTHVDCGGSKQSTNKGTIEGLLMAERLGRNPRSHVADGLKQQDLIGVPWRFAEAMRRDGWWVRSEEIWHKPNGFTESLFGWFWEQHRIRNPANPSDGRQGDPGDEGWHNHSGDIRNKQDGHGPRHKGFNARYQAEKRGEHPKVPKWLPCPGCKLCEPNGGKVLRRGGWRPTRNHETVFQFAKNPVYFCDGFAAQEDAVGELPWGGNPETLKSEDERAQGKHGATSFTQARSREEKLEYYGEKRNRRSVWSINTEPYKGAHFATYPTELLKPILQASVPTRACPTCGAAWAPVYDWTPGVKKVTGESLPTCQCRTTHEWARGKGALVPTCSRCGAWKSYEDYCWVPGTVLDPFGGTGTLAVEAYRQDKDAILCELNAEYAGLAEKRLRDEAGLWIETTVEEA